MPAGVGILLAPKEGLRALCQSSFQPRARITLRHDQVCFGFHIRQDSGCLREPFQDVTRMAGWVRCVNLQDERPGEEGHA